MQSKLFTYSISSFLQLWYTCPTIVLNYLNYGVDMCVFCVILQVMNLRKNVLNNINAITISSALTIGALAFSMINPTLSFANDAKCFGSYGQEIDCPVQNISFSIQKTVRKAGESTFVEQVNAGDDSKVEFSVTVKNTGDTTVSNVKLIDVLPANLTSTNSTDYTINDFAPNQERTFMVTATANVKGLAEGQTNCVVNVANVVFNNETKASDTASVCIKNGQVLATKLPNTGIANNGTIGLFVIAILSGFIIVNSTIIAEKARKFNG